jgi:hypothetical protein
MVGWFWIIIIYLLQLGLHDEYKTIWKKKVVIYFKILHPKHWRRVTEKNVRCKNWHEVSEQAAIWKATTQYSPQVVQKDYEKTVRIIDNSVDIQTEYPLPPQAV